ncbi:uncharacterized protein LOC119078071 isoform X1 [Bradysia coprophila]|uniref:uncharacterized protein LOC119078071 isoform X1 n=1 Tax=Bradysia coprophila TaxID=38358 RepID=UPI00187D98D1|nr:uncharacterized protein LOC119078071 isoform X1 [Bradysia coprophila]
MINAIGLTYGTCVFDSDFGFILNCNFKKSSLFRVRNLGGVKAHFGLGFSVGDELGFAESLGNVEGNKRRSLSERQTINTIGVLPASKQPAIQQQPIQQNKPQAWTARPPPAIYQKPKNGLAMTEAVSLPLGVPAFRPVPKTYSVLSTQPPMTAAQSSFNRKVMQQRPMQIQLANVTYVKPVRVQTSVVQSIPKPQMEQTSTQFTVPAFQALPQSVTKISSGQIVQLDSKKAVNTNTIYPSNYVKREDVNQPSIDDQSQFIAPQPFTSPLKLPKVDLMGHTVEELAAAANISVEAIQKAIQMKQQQLLAEQQAAMYKQQIEIMQQFATTTKMPTRPSTTTTTTTTTTARPVTKRYQISGGNKVMNAPKEYYPAGYEKNFDDNFMSKVDLPATSFHCGDQKHFPGLYADMDLGCMVFHVCALTDDGLIMKSFLCPESTLFDQTILKCNWWFYVDCKNSKSLYDSNLPVSKSYQLMKALTFFSNYKNSGSNGSGGVDVEALKNSVKSNETT